MKWLALGLLALTLLFAPPGTGAQVGRRPARLGALQFGSPPPPGTPPTAFTMALRELGWVEGQGIAFEPLYARGNVDQLPALAQELIRAKVDVLLTGGTAATRAAKEATATIPIVFIGVGDPVATGLVASLARPGGNVTGIATQHPESEKKRLELIRELLPQARDVAFVYNPNNAASVLALKDLQAAAPSLGVSIHSFAASQLSAFESVFSQLRSARIPLALVGIDPLFFSERRQIAEGMARHNIPAIYGAREFVESGGLMSYGPSLDDAGRRAAHYVDRILKGTRPADLPVEQPTRFELVVNLKTAKALGLTIRPSVLMRADDVIR